MSDSVQPVDRNLPVPLPMEMSQARKLQRVAISSSRGLLTQGSNLHLLHWQVDSLPVSHQGSPENPLNINYLMYLKCYSQPQERKSKCQSLSRVQLFVIPWTMACQAPLSMEFCRQEYWSGLPFPSPRDPWPRDQTQVGKFFTIRAIWKESIKS